MRKIIFDVDGVLLSEERYYDVSGLTVWEILFDKKYMGLASERSDFSADRLTDGQIAAIRETVWGGDALLSWLKAHGINSNWDMVHAYLTTFLALAAKEYAKRTGGERLSFSFREEKDFKAAGRELLGLPLPTAEKILDAWERAVPKDAKGTEAFDALGAAFAKIFGEVPDWAPLYSDFWKLHTEAFQAWYLGDDEFALQNGKLPYVSGKKGFLRAEIPLAPAAAISAMFERLKKSGYDIAVATGRSRNEMTIPFKEFGWYAAFDPAFLATATDAEEASRALNGIFLDKPHPFLYECAMWGRKPENYAEYAAGERKAGAEDEVWVIGDSYSDILGARAAGAKILGVLTGLEGEKAAAMFEAAGAPYVRRVTDAENFLLHLK